MKLGAVAEAPFTKINNPKFSIKSLVNYIFFVNLQKKVYNGVSSL